MSHEREGERRGGEGKERRGGERRGEARRGPRAQGRKAVPWVVSLGQSTTWEPRTFHPFHPQIPSLPQDLPPARKFSAPGKVIVGKAGESAGEVLTE